MNQITSSISSIKKEEEEEEENMSESIERNYNNLCLDLNLDNETKVDAWRSYEHIRKHYLLEGDQIHWLAVSLYVSCRRNRYLTSCDNNPISIKRLLKSSNNFDLMIFFDKLHKWQDMANLPLNIRNKIDQVEHAFSISSIIFKKYSEIFVYLFGGNINKYLTYDYQLQIKLNHKTKQKKLNIYHFYSFIWTIYAYSKTIYPSTINDLIASFNLLIASFELIYQSIIQFKLNHFIKGEFFNELDICEETIIDKLCPKYKGSSCETTRTIYEEHLKNDFIYLLNENYNINDLSIDDFYLKQINEINKKYDEIVLTNCIIDERIFLENKNQFNDCINSLNENRNCKSQINKTPLTANQHFISTSHQQINQTLTPISQANQAIQLLYSIVQQQIIKTNPNQNIISLIGDQLLLDSLVQRLNDWEKIFYESYDSNDFYNIRRNNNNQMNPSDSCKSRFDLSLKLFYNSLENILIHQKKRCNSSELNHQEIQQQSHELMQKNEFLKSLLGICLLLVLNAHHDQIHNLNWILNIYSLHSYSFYKIIQIYLQTCKQLYQCRSFVKYLSSIEETMLSSMVFSTDSSLWNEIETKGFLTYQQIQNLQIKLNNHSTTPTHQTPTNLTSMYFQSPNHNNVKRNLFSNSNSNNQPSNNCLSIIRSRSDPIVENNTNPSNQKMTPYIKFYRKLYELVLSRIESLCIRLYQRESNNIEKYIWNLFLFLFENHTKLLFQSRDLDQILLSCIYYTANSNQISNQQLTWTKLIQAYISMPNSNKNALRSVFIRQINSDQTNYQQKHFDKNPCLTPSKPAGTIHIIDGNLIGDITSFYQEIFLKIPNLDCFFSTNQLIDLPQRRKRNENQNEHISINIGININVDYSSNLIKTNSFSSTNQQIKLNSNNSNQNSSPNVLSSSIQAGANNTVRTTRTRTEDGKFLTTISTISKLNNLDSKNENIIINTNQTNLLFGQSTTNNSIKRTLSDDPNSNCLTSLTKKVLQIENDRQKLQQQQQQPPQ
ncbi:unnamed protein product [Adineta steineri]|uniref:Uncharacterized protein n=1 Tax=Adineta steineri TaxID=433720 RepID=A0A818K0N0_9BILA|nr:unnamed protein product [Adineta steineri]CAF3553831.1 unnamed protein product [Adineta steineri]